MQALKAVTRTLGLLFLIGVLFGIILITDSLLQTSKQSQLDYIPADAELVVRINSRSILSQTLQAVLIDSDDSKLVNKIYRKIIQRKRGGKQIASDGIDYLSDVVLFKMPFKTSYVIGVLVRLNDEDAFEEAIATNVTADRVAVAHNGVGLILSYNGTEKSHASAIDLEQLADNLLSNNTKKQKAPSSEESLISVSGKLGNFDLNLVDHEFILSGTFAPNNTFQNITRSHLKENGFHISYTQLSDLSIEFPDAAIDYFDLNFLEYGPAENNGLPKVNLEMLIGFKKKTDLLALISDKLGSAFVMNDNQKEISLMNQSFFYKKLNDSTYYLGSTEKPIIESTKSTSLFKISGAPSTFFNYKAEGFALAIIEMNPLFHASKQLAMTTESINIKMMHEQDKKLSFSGKIIFKDGTYPLHEIVRFLLEGNFLP
jgi:hypothetical protein